MQHPAMPTLPLLRFISATLVYTRGVRAGDEGCDMPSSVGAWNRDVITSDEAANNRRFQRMVSSGMLRRVALVRTDVSEEPSASIIRVTRIGELGTTLVATSNRCMLRSVAGHQH
jgi:hypothetical protein